MLWDFWNNKIEWEPQQTAPQTPPATQAQSTAPQTASFDQSFELLYRQMLNEIKPTSRATYNSNGNKTTVTSGPGIADIRSPITSSNPTSSASNKTKPENIESPTANNFPDNKYTLANLITAKDNKLPEAIALYNAFELLANYLKTEAAQFDWMGAIRGATTAIKSMSVAPQMGR